MPFGLWTRVGPRKHVAHWRHLANTTESSMYGGGAADCGLSVKLLWPLVIIYPKLIQQDIYWHGASRDFSAIQLSILWGLQKCNQAIVDYDSPALWTPVTPFPPIDDAAYHQRAGGPSHGHRQHAQKLVKIACGVPEISGWTDRQTDTQTDAPITILRNRSREQSKTVIFTSMTLSDTEGHFSYLIYYYYYYHYCPRVVADGI